MRGTIEGSAKSAFQEKRKKFVVGFVIHILSVAFSGGLKTGRSDG